MAQRDDEIRNIWKKGAYTLKIADEAFSFLALRGNAAPVPLDDLITSAEWTDDGPNLQGRVSYRRPVNVAFGSGAPKVTPLATVRQGDVVICRIAERPFPAASPDEGDFVDLWRMRVTEPTTTSVESGDVELQLATDLGLYRRSRYDWKFKQSKRKPSGWRAHEVARFVAKRMGMPIGKVPRGRHKLPDRVFHDTSGVDVVEWAYKQEARHEGLRFAVHFRNGKLAIEPLTYPKYLFELGPAIISAAVTRSLRKKAYATSLTVRSDGQKGKKKRDDISVKATVGPATLARYGRVHRIVKREGLKTPAAARRYGKRLLAAQWRPVREIALTHPGIARVKRGDAIKVYLPEELINEIVFIKEVTHSVSPGGYDMALTLGFSSPFIDDLTLKSAGLREEKKGGGPPSRSTPSPQRTDRPR